MPCGRNCSEDNSWLNIGGRPRGGACRASRRRPVSALFELYRFVKVAAPVPYRPSPLEAAHVAAGDQDAGVRLELARDDLGLDDALELGALEMEVLDAVLR